MNYYAFYDFKPTKLNPQRARKKVLKKERVGVKELFWVKDKGKGSRVGYGKFHDKE